MPPPPPASRRRTRGDGNCFFRAFLFGYLEQLLLSGDGAEAARALACLEGLKRQLVEVGGYDEIGAPARGACAGAQQGRQARCADGCVAAGGAGARRRRASRRLVRRSRAGCPPPPLLPANRSPLPTRTPPTPPAVLEAPLEYVLGMLRQVGAPLDPLTKIGRAHV